MSLVIEDGSIVQGASSYVTRTEFIGYAAMQGVAIPNTEAADFLLVRSAQFIDSHEPTLRGSRVSRGQHMAFPRSDLEIEGFFWADDEIPRQVILCQMHLALDLHAGIDIYNPEPQLIVKRERVEGAVEVEYFGEGTPVKLGRASRSRALLSALLRQSGLRVIALERA